MGATLAAIFFCCVFVTSTTAQGSCQLSESWRGSWFQSGFDNIAINDTSIDVKGNCLQKKGDYYLFQDKEEDCFRCLFIVQKHTNVLQYKESYCEMRDTLDNLCMLIPGDAQQFSLFRRQAAPVECPFRGSFTFTYSRGHGECRSPGARLDSCTESSRIFFRYQACPDVQGTESSEEELECLAAWKDGSLRYLMGRVQHQGATSDEDRYRCFVYERMASSASTASAGHRPTFLLAQSGDATCNGLTSPSEGSRTLKLSKGEGRRCRYPSWLLQHNHWQTLDGRWTYSLHKNSTLRIIDVSGVGPSASHAASLSSGGGGGGGGVAGVSVLAGIDSRQEQKAVCHSIIDLAENATRVVAHLSQGCQTGYVCMVFYRRGHHVVEFQAGEAAPAPEEACNPYYFNPVPGHYTTLIAPSRGTVACPMDGKFGVIAPQGTQRCGDGGGGGGGQGASSPVPSVNFLFGSDSRYRISTVTAGCSTPETIDLYHQCSREPSSGYVCRNTWTDDHDGRTKFVIVTALHRHDTPRRFCIAVSGPEASPSQSSTTVKPPSWQSQDAALPWQWIASSETCIRPYAR